MPELTLAKYKQAIYSDTYDNRVLAQKKIQPSTFFMFANIWFSTMIHLKWINKSLIKKQDNGLKYLITKAD